MSLYSSFLRYLNPLVTEITYKLSRLHKTKIAIRFSWCLAHVGIKVVR